MRVLRRGKHGRYGVLETAEKERTRTLRHSLTLRLVFSSELRGKWKRARMGEC
jgi:hypothetical protein